MDEVYQKLRESLQNGYSLHGSKHKHEILTPQTATCQSGDPDNCQTAVYASRDEIRVPILMALFDKRHWWYRGYSSYYHGFGEASTIEVGGKNLTLTPGYVHILPSDSFEKFGEEWLSFAPVTPVEIVQVEPAIIQYLNNIDWRDDLPKHLQKLGLIVT